MGRTAALASDTGAFHRSSDDDRDGTMGPEGAKRSAATEKQYIGIGLARSVHPRARRLGDVIRFAQYVRAEDPAHEVPHAVFGSERRTRPIPYIFSPDDIQRLVQAASESGYRSLRRRTYSTLFALLACTGLRVVACRFNHEGMAAKVSFERI